MNSYEERQEAKRQRYSEAADKAETRAGQRSKAAHDSVAGIPLGQPILVGHHSEGRHRRALARQESNMRKSIEESEKAAHYERKAAGVGKAGISSDDPDAVEKLKEKLAKMEDKREGIKRINRQYKKGGFDAVEGISDEARENLKKGMALTPYHGDVIFPAYVLTNLGGNIRRVKERIKALTAAAGMEPAQDIKGEGYAIREDVEENRICFEFDKRPSKEVCQMMRAHGFKWNKRLVAWTRNLNNAGRYSADHAEEAFQGKL